MSQPGDGEEATIIDMAQHAAAALFRENLIHYSEALADVLWLLVIKIRACAHVGRCLSS
jgi:hypothetical protein